MKNFVVEPLDGIGDIKLGMSRQMVRKIMGNSPETNGARNHVDSYFNGGFQVFYDSKENAEFIELSHKSGIEAVAMGIEVFGSTAEQVLDVITMNSSYNSDDLEVGYSYVFPDIELSLWRPSIPESEDDIEGQSFSTIGIGVSGYYSATIKE